MIIPATIHSVPDGGKAFALVQHLALKTNHPICCILHDAQSMQNMADSIAFFLPERPIYLFPAWDCLPYDRVSPQRSLMQQRLQTLIKLIKNEEQSPIILTTIHAIQQRVLPKESLADATFNIRKSLQLSQDTFIYYCIKHGYHRSPTATEPGDFAVRGNLLDIVSLSEKNLPIGYRIDFFGNEVEHIRLFDPLTQITQPDSSFSSITLYPMSEVFTTEETSAKFRHRYRQQFGQVLHDDPLYAAVKEQRPYPGIEHWLPFFYPDMATFFDYMPPDSIIVYDVQCEPRRQERLSRVQEYYKQRKQALDQKQHYDTVIYKPIRPDQLWLLDEDWEQQKTQHHWVELTSFSIPTASENCVDSGLKPVPNIASESTATHQTILNALLSWLEKENTAWKAYIACMSEGSQERIAHMLSLRDLPYRILGSWKEFSNLKAKEFGLLLLPIDAGCVTSDFILLSEQDLFGRRMRRLQSRKKDPSKALQDASNFVPGDIIVHRDHGVGRFEGLQTITVMDHPHDCLCLIYEGDDKLFLPVENIDLVTRYGGDADIKLDKLGGVAWQSRKASLKERIRWIAQDLLATAAKRLLKTTPPLESEGFDEFCARFPYVETEDQLRASEDILSDLTSGKIMDRLICGDVGFGKTEVAIRAAYLVSHAKNASKQVAIIVPTTLLARQHLKSFQERFASTAVRIAQLSRFTPKKEVLETKKALEAGRVDIVIGTHALLSDDIRFKDLGMVIIDEEQHFGVSQKEKLKNLRTSVHVLSLSATPIPRTLHMSLSGMRDLSLLATPPVDRLAVRTFVTPFDHIVIREALLREHQRGGQSFYVVPRIADLEGINRQLQEIVPELKIVQAHGRMSATQLDKIMTHFYEGSYDILLSTTIIESGLDIPTANTMIIHRADRFGLSQLYQLRGRVGRSHIRAYAYLTVPPQTALKPTAYKRLEAMQALDTLGAGFQLASHDMDIRGFGNLLGEEQSGQIKEVGIELYQQMLKETLQELTTHQEEEEDWSPQVNLGLSVMIPADYVEDVSLRMSLYRRVAQLSSEEELEAFAAELIDRFGAIPEPVEHLISTIRLKLMAKKLGIKKIDLGEKGASISFQPGYPKKPEKLISHVQSNAKKMRLRPDQKLTILWDNMSKADHIKELYTQLICLVNLDY